MLYLSLGLTGALVSCAEAPLDEACSGDLCNGGEAEAVVQKPEWVYVNNCATSISVTVNNIIYIVGCDPSGVGTVWHMRQNAAECHELACGDDEQIWAADDMQGLRARRVSVENIGGGGLATDDTGTLRIGVYQPFPGQRSSDVFLEPNLWETSITGSCVDDVEQYHVRPTGIWYVAPQPPFAVGGGGATDYRTFATSCNANARGDRDVLAAIGPAPGLRPTGHVARELAIFADGTTQAMWGLRSDGSMFSYTTATGEAREQPTPPATAYDLTDHFAATESGIYEFVNGGWQLYIANRTASGARIKQIAHAGRVVASLATRGPSLLWGIDEAGNIYKAVVQTTPR